MIHRQDPDNAVSDHISEEVDKGSSITVDEGEEFEDSDGCFYRLLAVSVDWACVQFRRFYPQRNNPILCMEKSFNIRTAKEKLNKDSLDRLTLLLSIHRHQLAIMFVSGKLEA